MTGAVLLITAISEGRRVGGGELYVITTMGWELGIGFTGGVSVYVHQ